MKITHFSNSFITVESQGDRIVCDPWVGKANAGGWQSFPEYGMDELAEHLKDVKWVYVSHLHDDHFHADTLRLCGLIDREFIIKRFQSPILKDRLARLGVTRIHEIDPFTVHSFGPFELSIFPQMTSNASCLDDDVNYDLDTSITIKAEGVVFFNQVDNPLSLKDLEVIKDFIHKSFGEIDIACIMSGAASEYPHLFLNIDQAAEKRRIVENSLNDLVQWLTLLQPKYFFPAGGTYIIPGWMNIYNETIAQPTFHQIADFVQKAGLTVETMLLEGGKFLEIPERSSEILIGTSLSPIETDRKTAIEMHRNDKYMYEEIERSPWQNLIQILDAARNNWCSKVNQQNLQIRQSIRFDIYKELRMVGREIDKSQFIESYSLFNQTENNAGQLIIHIDQRAILGCVTRRLVWNGVLGTLCLYERSPNHFYPTDFFSINFFVLTNEQISSFKSNS